MIPAYVEHGSVVLIYFIIIIMTGEVRFPDIYFRTTYLAWNNLNNSN